MREYAYAQLVKNPGGRATGPGVWPPTERELMTVSIIHAYLRWALDLCVRDKGRHRAVGRPAAPVPGLGALGPEGPRTAVPLLPVPRSPYGLDGPLDGTASALVRPYLGADERQRALQSRRRLALVLAAGFAIDVDRHVVDAERVVAC